MARFRNSAAAALIALPVALPVQAQEDRDPGFLAGLIEDNLSAPGLSVQIDGFEGALSSEASVEEIRISDDEGVWLVLRDVVLDWNRSALLRGRLEVEELTAALIRLDRTPLPAEGIEPPPAAAQGFSLPDLPVSIDVEQLAAERIELGAPVLGEEVALTLQASARLDDGTGSATLAARRLDGPEGTYAIEVAYGGEGEALSIALDIAEAQGGLASTQIGLPGAPAIELTIDGEGPLDAFVADIALASDGQPRLAGDVTLQGVENGRRFEVDLSGDVTELFAPAYKPFFGDDVALLAQGLIPTEGGTDLDTLRLTTEALQVEGTARLGADGWPEFLNVDGTLASADGGPVLLPTSDRMTAQGAELSLSYDPAVSDVWSLDLTLDAFETPTLSLGTARVTGSGRIDRDDGTVGGATAAVEATLATLDFSDDALDEAVGSQVDLTADIAWSQDAPVRLTGLELAGDGYRLRGDVDVSTGVEGLPIDLDLAATLTDLSRFSGVAGADLAGDAQASLSGQYAPVAGTFDLALSAEATGLATGIAQVDSLLNGRTRLTTGARRTEQGDVPGRLRLVEPATLGNRLGRDLRGGRADRSRPPWRGRFRGPHRRWHRHRSAAGR